MLVILSAYATSEPAPEPRPGPTGMFLVRVVYEVVHYQKVIDKAAADDDAELVIDALVVLGLGDWWLLVLAAVSVQSTLQASLHQAA